MVGKNLSIEEKIRGAGFPPGIPPTEDPGGGGNGSSEPLLPAQPLFSNAQLAMVVFIAAELMFFSGLIGAFLVFRFSGAPWPPPTLPRLPVGVTAANTLILLLSSATMARAQRAARRAYPRALLRHLAATGALGTLFLAVQGYEWIRLVEFGLTVTSGTYGSTFYTIIGTHGVHVAIAVTWLLLTIFWQWLHPGSAGTRTRMLTCGMYWHFVVGLWPFLFFLVYLL